MRDPGRGDETSARKRASFVIAQLLLRVWVGGAAAEGGGPRGHRMKVSTECGQEDGPG